MWCWIALRSMPPTLEWSWHTKTKYAKYANHIQYMFNSINSKYLTYNDGYDKCWVVLYIYKNYIRTTLTRILSRSNLGWLKRKSDSSNCRIRVLGPTLLDCSLSGSSCYDPMVRDITWKGFAWSLSFPWTQPWFNDRNVYQQSSSTFFCCVCFWVRWGCLPWWFAYRWVSDPLLDWCYIFCSSYFGSSSYRSKSFRYPACWRPACWCSHGLGRTQTPVSTALCPSIAGTLGSMAHFTRRLDWWLA